MKSHLLISQHSHDNHDLQHHPHHPPSLSADNKRHYPETPSVSGHPFSLENIFGLKMPDYYAKKYPYMAQSFSQRAFSQKCNCKPRAPVDSILTTTAHQEDTEHVVEFSKQLQHKSEYLPPKVTRVNVKPSANPYCL